ncbi:CTRB1 [Branchiostoma lanceolatum]|uniref:CTRB1 protein n=2 Tax=Branchiostoma lanceolatum TaxID=7740 RepID=A0A8S4MPT6_BRALA|nr:CTRB1 [Branchiostoma lanceolatum]
MQGQETTMGIGQVMMIVAVLVAAKAAEAKSCGGTFSGSAGVVTSPGYPASYGANLRCEYVFTAEPGQVTQVVFESFALQEKSGWWLFKTCRDYVEVYDGDNQIGKYCGDDSPGIISTSSELRVVFTSDDNTEAPGFFASFIRTACGGIFSGDVGKASSPDYPENYANNLNCEYVFPADGRMLTISFEEFSLEGKTGWFFNRKCRDSITVYDGDNKLGEYCGDDRPETITTVSDVRLVFTTNKDKTDYGFFAVYTRIDDVVITLPPTDPPLNTDAPTAGRCGISRIQPRDLPGQNRIVNGQEAIPHSWPWQISLQTSDGDHFCGGSLVTENWVITAAHCKPNPSAHLVVLGEHDRDSNSEITQRIRIEKSISHPQYVPTDSAPDYDICLVKLATPARIGETVSPVCLPGATDSFGPEEDCYVSGWGKTSGFGFSTARKLQQARTELLSTPTCRNTWGSSITDRMICAGADGTSACQGDSGGPLVCQRAGAWQLVGVVSWGGAFCSTWRPAVFARVTELREWLDQNMAENN